MTKRKSKGPGKGSGLSVLNLVLLLAIIAVLSITLTIVIYINTAVEDVIVTPYMFKVKARTIGLNADTDRLAFGSAPPGGFSKRSFTLKTERDVIVIIEAEGEHSDWLFADKNSFLLPAGGSTTVEMTVMPPDDAIEGEYEGDIRSIFLRPGMLTPKFNPMPTR